MQTIRIEFKTLPITNLVVATAYRVTNGTLWVAFTCGLGMDKADALTHLRYGA